MAQQVQRIDQWEIPPELGALAKDHTNMRGHFATLMKWIEASYSHLSGAGHEDAGQHFDRGAFARAIRTYQTNNFPWLDVQ
jgi:hypothetical protein